MRRNDWQERFAAYLRARREMPFAWGTHDCCTFAAGAVEAISGRNPMAAIAPYADERTAARMVRDAGGLTPLASSLLGDPVTPLLAAVGDVVLLENGDRELLGICNGTTAIAAALDGMAAIEMTAALAAWKI